MAVLATLSSITGTLGRAVPSPSLSSSSQLLGSPSATPTTYIRQGHPKQFLPEHEDDWENGVNPHEHPGELAWLSLFYFLLLHDRTVCQLAKDIRLIIVHGTVPSVDINEADAQSYHQRRDIDLGNDDNSLEEDDGSIDGINPEEDEVEEDEVEEEEEEEEEKEEGDDNSGNLHQHAARAAANWNEYVQKGQKFIKDLESAVKNKHSTANKFNEFRTWNPNNKKPESLPSEVGGAMNSDGIPHAQSQHYKYWEAIDPKSRSQYSGFFESGENPKAFVEKRMSKNGNPNLQMSEVSFQLLSWALDDGDESLDKLEYIYKPEIKNPVSSDLMKQAYEKSCEQGDRIVFKPEDDEFKALLASPNGALVPRMLIDHAAFFKKTVKEIRLYHDKNMLVFKIG